MNNNNDKCQKQSNPVLTGVLFVDQWGRKTNIDLGGI